MAYERLERYDSSTDGAFQDAVLQHLIEPACYRLQRRRPNAWDKEGRLATTASVDDGNGNRHEYDFYATKSSPEILIHAVQCSQIDDVLSEEAIGLMLDAMLSSSDLTSDIKVQYWNNSSLLHSAIVEQYMCYTYHINVTARKLWVATDVGFTVDGGEVDVIPVVVTGGTDLDYERQTLFSRDEIDELTRGIYEMGLADRKDIDAFRNEIAMIAQ